MKSRAAIAFVLAVPLAIVAGALLKRDLPPRQSAIGPGVHERDALPAEEPLPAPLGAEALLETAPAASESAEIHSAQDRAAITPANPRAAAASVKTPPSSVPKTTQRVRRPKEPIRDPLAREALYYVGADPRAEAYWFEAINDPSLSADERKDLIEDLNEDGISDPKHPTVDDLPLIVRRIRLLEAVGPDPMDDINADAFREAYKDLVNLAYVAIGGGERVR